MHRMLLGFFLIVLLFLPPFAFAQSSEAVSESAQALQFQIDSDFQLSSFQGSLLSYKRHLSSSTALRIGASFNLQSRDREFTLDDAEEESPRVSSQLIELRGQYLSYLGGENDIEPYLGAGLGISYARESEEDPPQFDNGTLTRSAFGVGINGVAGVEWFAWSSISFTAEYGARFRYITEGQTFDPEEQEELSASRSQWQFGGNGVLFGLSVYF